VTAEASLHRPLLLLLVLMLLLLSASMVTSLQHPASCCWQLHRVLLLLLLLVVVVVAAAGCQGCTADRSSCSYHAPDRQPASHPRHQLLLLLLLQMPWEQLLQHPLLPICSQTHMPQNAACSLTQADPSRSAAAGSSAAACDTADLLQCVPQPLPLMPKQALQPHAAVAAAAVASVGPYCCSCHLPRHLLKDWLRQRLLPLLLLLLLLLRGALRHRHAASRFAAAYAAAGAWTVVSPQRCQANCCCLQCWHAGTALACQSHQSCQQQQPQQQGAACAACWM
jgi:hypothetical protein